MRQETAAHLRLIAQMMALDGANGFRTRAFSKAADAVEYGVADIGEVNNPSTIDGIGKSTADVITEFLETGGSARARALEAKLPGVVDALTMTIVDGIGARTAYKFYNDRGIHNFNDLVAAAERGELREKLTTAIRFAKDKTAGRIPYLTTKLIADHIADSMHDIVERIQICGSFRRQKTTSKDIDVVALLPSHATREEVFECFVELGEVINVGDKKSSIWVTKYNVSMQVDLWLVNKWYWGSALHYATGSKDHVKDIRTQARARGYTVNEYGVFKTGVELTPENQLAGKTEKSMYDFFGLKYPEPEDREGKAEVA